MNKKDVQKRVLKDGKPLPLKDFTWCEKTKTFSSNVDGLVLDFRGVDGVTFNTGSECTFKTGSDCTFKTGSYCTFDTGSDCTFKTGRECTFKTVSYCTFDTGPYCNFDTVSYCTFDTGSYCTFDTGWSCTFKTGTDCTFNTGSDCTFKTGSGCTFNTGSDCTFKTESECTFNTGSECTFDTESYCTFKTGSYCTFKTGSGGIFDTESYCTFKTGSYCTFNTSPECNFNTGSDCTFKTGSGCTFKTGYDCVIVRRDIREVIQPNIGEKIELFPFDQKGYLTNGMYKGEPHIIADGIVSKIINQKGSVYKVKNLGEDKESWLIKDGDTYAHGETLKEAREDLLYKAKDKDTSAYKDYTLDTVVTHADALKMYRTITGACSSGMKHFVEQKSDEVKDEYTVAELIELTAGAYGNDKFKQVFKGE